MNCRHRSKVTTRVVSLTALAFLAAFAISSSPVMAVEPSSRTIYTAGDFPQLAQGVDPGFSGDAFVSVWAPASENWHLRTSDATITLWKEAGPADPTPRWQSLGKLDTAKGRMLKDRLLSRQNALRPKPRPLPTGADAGQSSAKSFARDRKSHRAPTRSRPAVDLAQPGFDRTAIV